MLAEKLATSSICSASRQSNRKSDMPIGGTVGEPFFGQTMLKFRFVRFPGPERFAVCKAVLASAHGLGMLNLTRKSFVADSLINIMSGAPRLEARISALPEDVAGLPRWILWGHNYDSTSYADDRAVRGAATFACQTIMGTLRRARVNPINFS